jgi:uncharacterized protein (TIGR03067 family)
MNFILSVFFLLFVSSVLADGTVEGVWEGIDSNGKKVNFIFEKTEALTIIIGESVIGKNIKGGKEYRLNYMLDSSKTPNELDLIQRTEGSQTVTKVIFKKIDDNRIMMYSKGYGNERPAKFGFKDPKNLLILFKQKY